MEKVTPDDEYIELDGGILDGLLIRFQPGQSPREKFEVERMGARWIYRRTVRRTAAGATVFRLEGRAATPSP